MTQYKVDVLLSGTWLINGIYKTKEEANKKAKECMHNGYSVQINAVQVINK